MNVANASFSQRPFHHFIVTRSPNHMWASSWATTSATRCSSPCVAVAGSVTGAADFRGTPLVAHNPRLASTDIAVALLDGTGLPVWGDVLGGDLDDVATGVAYRSDDVILVGTVREVVTVDGYSLVVRGATDAIAVDMHYYNFVDRHNTLGLGLNVPLTNGTNSDSLLALLPDGRFVRLRVPYPLGYYSRGLDGRIDDPNGGWKGRGLWSNYGTHFVWHIEGGKGTKGKIVKFQMRPNPLAR